MCYVVFLYYTIIKIIQERTKPSNIVKASLPKLEHSSSFSVDPIPVLCRLIYQKEILTLGREIKLEVIK